MRLFSIFNTKTELGRSGLFHGATDRHSHILPGVDDGIKTIEDAINEAVELTKKYSVTEDASFVNGLLGSMVKGKD